jgi:acetyltransferase
MTIRNLHKIFQPRRIAVVGASDSPSKVGNQVLRNLLAGAFPGDLYAVNPKHSSVLGVASYPSLSALPQIPDLVVICTPASTTPSLIGQCGRLGIDGVIILSAGFREVGEKGVQLEAELKAAAARHPGLRILGPNCLGVMVPSAGLNASFAASNARPGKIAFVSQSGALCTAVLDWAESEGIGFSHFISVGNMLDVGFDDLLDYLAADPSTTSVVLYIESILKAREFMSAARAFSRAKPIVAYKAGRFAASAAAAASHTGALAGVDAVYEAAFRRAGIVRLFDLDEVFDCAELLSGTKSPHGPNLAIITNAGGPGVMACDSLIDRRGVLAKLSPTTIDQLNSTLPEYWSHRNPVDLLGDAPPQRYEAALEIVLTDPGVDAVLVLLTPQAMTNPTESAAAVARAAQHSKKPVLASWMGAASVAEGVAQLRQAGIPTYPTAEHAIRAFMRLVEFQSNREKLLETPRDVPLAFTQDRTALRRRFEATGGQSGHFLSELESKELLALYGIPVTVPQIAATAEQAVQIATKIGFPVVLKLLSQAITHKTEVGGVILDLADPQQVRRAYAQIIESAKTRRPDADIGGVTVQPMATQASGAELILGIKRDPVFGPVIMVGAGGVTAELAQDVALELPPLNEVLARKMLQSLRLWPLLSGYRGRPPAAIDRLIETILRLSTMALHIPEIRELDVNPLLVMQTEVLALDARILIENPAPLSTRRPHSHLAISPYPEEYSETLQLSDQTKIHVRAIRPEDEPAWKDLIRRSSTQSLWQRFRYLFKEATHEMAARFCFVDYDRELALCAWTEVAGKRSIVGIARLVVDPDYEQADYAVLIADDFQRRGLGSLLTQKSLEICRRLGLKRICSETTASNHSMLHIYAKYGFEVKLAEDPTIVLAAKELGNL